METSETKNPTVVNGRRYSLWPQFVAKKDEYIGGTLQEKSDGIIPGANKDGWFETLITDITFGPNGDDSAMFEVSGKGFSCGSDVQYLHVDPSHGGDGWLAFGGYGGHLWRIRKRIEFLPR